MNQPYQRLKLTHWPDNGCIWRSFDRLYQEGAKGSPKWAEVVLHAHVAGRPSARRRDIAQWLPQGAP